MSNIDEIDNSMNMIDEIISLLDAIKKAFYGVPKLEKYIRYKGATIKITVEVEERFGEIKDE